jgi:hypothetical protein
MPDATLTLSGLNPMQFPFVTPEQYMASLANYAQYLEVLSRKEAIWSKWLLDPTPTTDYKIGVGNAINSKPTYGVNAEDPTFIVGTRTARQFSGIPISVRATEGIGWTNRAIAMLQLRGPNGAYQVEQWMDASQLSLINYRRTAMLSRVFNNANDTYTDPETGEVVPVYPLANGTTGFDYGVDWQGNAIPQTHDHYKFINGPITAAFALDVVLNLIEHNHLNPVLLISSNMEADFRAMTEFRPALLPGVVYPQNQAAYVTTPLESINPDWRYIGMLDGVGSPSIFVVPDMPSGYGLCVPMGKTVLKERVDFLLPRGFFLAVEHKQGINVYPSSGNSEWSSKQGNYGAMAGMFAFGTAVADRTGAVAFKRQASSYAPPSFSAV